MLSEVKQNGKLNEKRRVLALPELTPPRTVRLKFCKVGTLQYISHLDLQRTFNRIINRACLPVWLLYEHIFAPVDISRFMNRDGYLHVWVWVEDMSTQLWGESIQLTSSGHSDEDCLFWVSTSYLTHNGWNELWLSLADAKRRGNFDPTAANYFRMATVHNPRRNHGRTYFSDVYFCTATSDHIRTPMPQTDMDRPTAPRP